MKNTYKLTLYTDEGIGTKKEITLTIDADCINPRIFIPESFEKFDGKFVEKESSNNGRINSIKNELFMDFIEKS